MFKVGDKVRVVKTGALGWEGSDWAECAYSKVGLEYPDGIATISEVKRNGSVTINGSDLVINKDHFEFFNDQWTQEYLGSSLVQDINKSKNKIMSNIKEFAKNLLLSKEEKMLREVGLKDSRGEYTDDAKELVIEKIVSENEQYLVSIAEKKLAESKK